MAQFIDCSGKVKEHNPTKFTHVMNGDLGWEETDCTVEEFDIIKYLGKCQFDGDVFAVYHNRVIEIFKGIKGSEF